MAICYHCPFFGYDRGKILGCEGSRISFPDAKARWEHIHDFCASREGWKQCQHAQMMENFYERTEKKP